MNPFKLFNKKNNADDNFLEALQIEVSSRCNLKCKFCPTTYINHPGENELLSFDLYKKLEPYFSWAKWVYLQGWGEPLLNPDFWKMVALAKNSGVKVGLTTNGTLFNKKNIANIFTYDIDLISFSIAGAKSSTHNNLRVNSDLHHILEIIGNVLEIKKHKRTKLPIIKLSYMLTKDTIAELPEALEIAYRLGVDDFYTTNLDYIFNEETNKNTLISYFEKPNPLYEKYILKAQKFAHSQNFSFRSYPLELKQQLPICDLDPNRFIFITSNGDVTPCTYLGRIENPRYFQDKFCILPRKKFGNIGDDSLETIWNSEDYISFRTNFAIRFAAYQDLMVTLTDFEPSLFKMKDAEKRYHNIIKNNPVPQECETCPKIYGI